MTNLYWKLKYLFRSATHVIIAPTRIIAFILFIIAWSTGAVHGILAWVLLLLLLDMKMTFKL